MTVKLTSEITHKEYVGNNYEKTLKTMKEDEERFLAEQKEHEAANKTLEDAAKNTASIKKKLCASIKEAEKLIDTAHQHYVDTYKAAQTDITNAREAYNKTVADALKIFNDKVESNQNAVKSARNAEAEARKTYNMLVADYHNRFDKNYARVLEGEEAVKEYNRICKELAEINPFFAWFL